MVTETMDIKRIDLIDDAIVLTLNEEKYKETESVILFFYDNEDYIFGNHVDVLINIPIDKKITAHARLSTFSNTNRASMKVPVDLTKQKKTYPCQLVINDYDNSRVLKTNMSITIV